MPEEHQWHLRLEAQPVRTDMAPGETGTLRLEGTLGGADTHSSLADVPIDLRGTWQDAQLGGLTSLMLGRDAGLRGDFALTFGVLGTIGRNDLTAALQLHDARRADFIPARLLSLSAGCHAIAENSFHSFTGIECHLPSADSSDPAILAVTAAVPDVRRPQATSVNLMLPSLPARTFLDWLSVATPHTPTGFAGDGTLAGALAWGETDPQAASVTQQPTWSGELKLSGESLSLPALGADPIPLGDVFLRSPALPVPPPAHSRSRGAVLAAAPIAPDGFDLLPVSLPLGGKQPLVLTGHVDDTGYTLHLAGNAIVERLLALGDAIPQLGDGLRQLLNPALDTPAPASPVEAPAGRARRSLPPAAPVESAPVAIDLTATRAWGGPQVWTEAPSQVLPPAHRHARR